MRHDHPNDGFIARMAATPPSSMTAAERLDEIASILAVGCRRLLAREAARAGANKPETERSFASTSPPASASMDAKPARGERK